MFKTIIRNWVTLECIIISFRSTQMVNLLELTVKLSEDIIRLLTAWRKLSIKVSWNYWDQMDFNVVMKKLKRKTKMITVLWMLLIRLKHKSMKTTRIAISYQLILKVTLMLRLRITNLKTGFRQNFSLETLSLVSLVHLEKV